MGMIDLSQLGERFEDDRGYIQNVLERSCGGVSLIFSKAGTSRSHHFHRKDAHFLYVLEGEIRYVEQPHGPRGSGDQPSRRTIKKGEMVFTPEMVEHSTYFPVDTLLLSMSRFERTRVSHEQDVVRLEKPLV
jgi:dTDP-4-dehydrorhamnose 3,5-epimerase-like enzyme